MLGYAAHMPTSGAAAERWRAALEAWTIPETILSRAPESPYGFPAEHFRRRAERALSAAAEATPTLRRAAEALGDGGEVLDVGCGSGAISLPLARHATRLTGVDENERMLEAFADAAVAAGVPAATICGRWPDVAERAEPADVVVCGHVLYNVPDLDPFVLALDRHARRRVVLEITERHPWAWMHDLWLAFHDLERPAGPTAADAVAALREAGFAPAREDRTSTETGGGGFERKADAVALVRRRLCLPAERDPEVEAALGDRLASDDEGLWSAGPSRHVTVTLWWDAAR